MVLFLYVASGCQADVPIFFLEGAGRTSKFKRQQRYEGEFQELVEELYLQADVDLMVQLSSCPYELLAERQLWKACLYLLERNIFVSSDNHFQGVTPNAGLLGEHFGTLVPEVRDDQRDPIICTT